MTIEGLLLITLILCVLLLAVHVNEKLKAQAREMTTLRNSNLMDRSELRAIVNTHARDVEKTYATIDDLQDAEGRLTDHLARIEMGQPS